MPKKSKEFSEKDKERLIRMGWEDRTSFEAIHEQFDLSPNEFVKFMRKNLSAEAFKRWRRRATERGHLKHEKKRPFKVGRFKSTRQRIDGSTKGWK